MTTRKIKIGRRRDNDIVLTDKRVSGYHAEILLVEGSFFLTDKSLNGTSVNGRMVNRDTVKIKKTDIVRVGTDSVDWLSCFLKKKPAKRPPLKTRVRCHNCGWPNGYVGEQCPKCGVQLYSRKQNPESTNAPEAHSHRLEKDKLHFSLPKQGAPGGRGGMRGKPKKRSTRGRSFFTKLRNAFAKNKKGKIVCSLPKRMTVGVGQKAVVRISRKGIEDSLLETGLSAENLKRDIITTGKVMVVSVFEGGHAKNFRIDAYNNLEQALNEDGYNEWIFLVTPQRVGYYNLVVRVSIIVNVKNLGEKTQDLMVWCREIKVGVDPKRDVAGEVKLKKFNWTQSVANHMKTRIKEGEIGLVFQDMANYLQIRDVDLFNDLVNLHSMWNQLRNEKNMDMIDYTDWSRKVSKITDSLLKLIDSVKGQRNTFSDSNYHKEYKRLKHILEQ